MTTSASIVRFARMPGRRSLAAFVLACMCLATSGTLALPEALASGDAHAEHEEIGYVPEPSTSPAEFKSDLAIWSFAVFLGLLGVLTAFAWKPIMQGLDKREQGIADTIAKTNAAHEEARRQLASYERRLAEAADEVRGMLEEARRDSEATKQAIVAEARKAADEEQARAKREIDLAKDDALVQISRKAGELAVEVAGKFLRDKLGPDDQARLVRDSLAGIAGRPSPN